MVSFTRLNGIPYIVSSYRFLPLRRRVLRAFRMLSEVFRARSLKNFCAARPRPSVSFLFLAVRCFCNSRASERRGVLGTLGILDRGFTEYTPSLTGEKTNKRCRPILQYTYILSLQKQFTARPLPVN